MQPSRRGFIAGLAATFIAGPAIVRASSLMPVKALSDPVDLMELLRARIAAAEAALINGINASIYGDASPPINMGLATLLPSSYSYQITPYSVGHIARWVCPAS